MTTEENTPEPTQTETTVVAHEVEKPAEPDTAAEAAAAHEASRSNEEKATAKSAVEENAAAQFAEAEKPLVEQTTEAPAEPEKVAVNQDLPEPVVEPVINQDQNPEADTSSEKSE